MNNITYLGDYQGDYTATIKIKRAKKEGKHPADNFDAICKALKDIGYEVTSMGFSTPNFMKAIESPSHD